MQQYWIQKLAAFPVTLQFVNELHQLTNALQNNQYFMILMDMSCYDSTAKILQTFGVGESTYFIGESYHTLDDVKGFRLLRNPLLPATLLKVLNDQWNAEDYMKKAEAEFVSPDARILVADDNTMNLRLMAKILEKYEIIQSVATSADECLKKVKENDYDILFIDQTIPGGTGMNLMEQIRSLGEEKFLKMPIVLLSDSHDAMALSGFVQLGFTDALPRPINVRALERILHNLLPSKLVKAVSNEAQREVDAAKQATKAIIKGEPGLNTSKGLLNIGFNQAAYEAILNTYYQEGLKNLSLLPELRDSEDLSLFTTYVHGIKSASASIGAMEVSDCFKQLEFAGKENRRKFIEENYEEFAGKLEEMLEIVKNYLIEHNAFVDKEEETVEEDNREEEKIRTMDLETLKNYLDSMNLNKCEEMLTMLLDHNYGAVYNRMIRDLKNGYDNFDFHSMKKTLAEMLEKVNAN